MNTTNMKPIKASFILVIAVLIVQAVQAQTQLLRKPVNTVIISYLSVKNALAAGDGKGAETQAKALLNALNEVPIKGLKNDETILLTKLQYDTRHISEVDRIPHQREHFASLSNNMYTLLKKLKVNSILLYRQYCKMTKNYYLSSEEMDKDPYMGMNNCSKVTETLKPVQ